MSAFTERRQFVAYFYFVGWDCINLGVSVCVSLPNIEIHLPFGFLRVGFAKVYLPKAYAELSGLDHRTFGLGERDPRRRAASEKGE